MGVYMPLVGGVQLWKCSKWITTLQQAELLALLKTFQLVAHMKWRIGYVGTDSFVAHQQCINMRCSSALAVQSRLLRRLFWFRSWCPTNIHFFSVQSALNPADPPS